MSPNETYGGVVDYVLTTPALFDSIDSFEIGNKLPESDHVPIMFKLKCDIVNTKYSGGEKIEERWSYCRKYKWSYNDMDRIKYTLNNDEFTHHFSELTSAMSERNSSEHVAKLLNNLVTQACDKVCEKSAPAARCRPNSAPWYDNECRQKRSLAIKAGERIYNEREREILAKACKSYRSCKQRKKRQYFHRCLNKLEDAYFNDRGKLWNTINSLSKTNNTYDEPSGQDLVIHFKHLSAPNPKDYFSSTLENEAKQFFCNYVQVVSPVKNDIAYNIINDNFTTQETEHCIDCLKNNKSPGVDGIPAELLKSCKNELSEWVTQVLNYIIEQRNFPESWSEGLRSSIYKAGDRLLPDSYRGITILPIFEKIFEMAVYKRLSFVNEAFNKIDPCNGGFINDSRTSDNLFILNGLIERQLNMGQSLYVCFIDFSKAFDLVNRDILFYKLVKMGWTGRVMDTLRNLYSKTNIRVKHKGKISSSFENKMGVNQGGVLSGLLFRKYLCDLGNYLKREVGVCIDQNILVHFLWADDLFVISNTVTGLQKQIDGIFKFASENQMGVNEIKTKSMGFGDTKPFKCTSMGAKLTML